MPNEQLVEQLQTALDQAKSGELVGAAIIGLTDFGSVFYSFTLSNPLLAIGQLELLKKKLIEIAESQ